MDKQIQKLKKLLEINLSFFKDTVLTAFGSPLKNL